MYRSQTLGGDESDGAEAEFGLEMCALVIELTVFVTQFFLTSLLRCTSQPNLLHM